MSKPQGRTTEELAYLLWERQGRPENRLAENWVEAEYYAHPRAASQGTINPDEGDLRMRGLGPLTLNGDVEKAQNATDTAAGADVASVPRIARPFAVAMVAGTVLIVIFGVILSLFRKKA